MTLRGLEGTVTYFAYVCLFDFVFKKIVAIRVVNSRIDRIAVNEYSGTTHVPTILILCALR